MNQPLEKKLSRRLKILGYILFAFACVALFYDWLPNFSDEIDEELSLEIKPPATLNPFFVSAVFVAVGSSCLLLSRKRTSRETDESE